MSARRRSSGAIDLGGLTPLLDTVFLLIFGLLALSRSADVTELVRVELPVVDSEQDPSPGPERRLVLVIDADSVVRVPVEPDAGGPEPAAGRAIETREALDAELFAALSGPLGGSLPEEVTVEIQADASARHGVAVELLQHLRLAGFSRVELLATGATDATGAFGTSSGSSRAGAEDVR